MDELTKCPHHCSYTFQIIPTLKGDLKNSGQGQPRGDGSARIRYDGEVHALVLTTAD